MAEVSSGLVYAHRITGDRRTSALAWADIDAWQPEQGLLWVHLDAANETALGWLTRKSGLSPMIREALLEQGTRPRSAVSETGVLIIIRGVNCNPGADPEDMVAVRMFISDRRIITMRRNRVMAVQDIHEALCSGNGPATAGEFLVSVVDRITDRIGEIVADIEDRVAEIEDTIVSAETAALRPRLAELRRESISLRRYIAPQRDMLARLTHERIAWLTDSDRTLLRETAERTARYVEDIDAARERALISQEELNNRLAERMNRAMYTLSIVAAIFLPLGLLTGLLGINVGGIPGTENPKAFLIVTVFLVVLAIVLVGWFRKIKWL
ncbi:zinc transporter ZntB [Desulfosarcina alkanivorans]|uniref:Zinc transporter ZntB n=2 Tax=Desulfosarcina alkanivorans TaxID=571177 RepID=A0A5K7YQ27_9BACT|nr:zinc transporter ZntB [Desulfosarcina alkanivorans]